MIVSADVFLDSNILIYAATGSQDAPEKHAISQGLLTTTFGISAQVLAEFYHNVTRKGSKPLSESLAMEWIDTLSRKPCLPVDASVVRAGSILSQKFKTSYWDGAILAAASLMDAKTVYSEDLNHGQYYGETRVINPFKPHPDHQ